MVRQLFFLPVHNEQDRFRHVRILVNSLIVVVLMALLFWFAFSRLNYRFNWGSVWRYRENLLRGFGMTVVISAFSLILSIVIGAVIGLGQRARFLPLRFLSKTYIEVIRGTPLLVQILIFFYVVANAFGIANRYVVGIVIMAVFSGAYVSEIIRGGVESVAASQLESARSLGFTRMQTYRYIIVPQVITRILPPMAGQLASLVKDSSLLSIIAVNEFTQMAREVNANTFSTLESYIPLAVGYLAITLPISMLTSKLERKYAYAD
ncbi:MAG: amino acid ABC transporter permease [Alkalispirochaeta sp.]|jgi:polar amino acid transport system permease protein